MSATSAPSATPIIPRRHGVILFDGTCAFCEWSVLFIANRDPQGYFRFGASQSPQAGALLESFGLTAAALRSLILIEGDQVYLRSTAALRIAGRLVWPWSLLAGLLWIPVPARDLVYRVVAAIRHSLAGRSTVCDIPPRAIRGRML